MPPLTNKTTEEREGPTPNGGVRSVAAWRDSDGNPCPKAEAKAVEITEYAEDGEVVSRIYARINHPVVRDVVQ